jgi:SAM-dependent methyltransferase
LADQHRYLLGMEPGEIDRLARQDQVWRSQTRRLWNAAGIHEGQTVLDLGSGPGFCTLELAELVGSIGRVIAVDASGTATQTVTARARKADLTNIVVFTATASEFNPSPQRIDVVFSRWLFCFLPNPAEVLSRVAAYLPTGATIVVMDYWHYRAIRTEPLTPLFARVFEAVYDSFADAGGSLDVGGQLPALFRAAGLDVLQIEPLTQIGRVGSPCWRWVADFQDSYLPTLVREGYLTAAEVSDYRSAWQEQERNPDAFIYSPPVLGVIGRKR